MKSDRVSSQGKSDRFFYRPKHMKRLRRLVLDHSYLLSKVAPLRARESPNGAKRQKQLLMSQ